MPYYMTQWKYTNEQLKAMVQKPQDREAAARKMIEAHGLKLHSFFFAFGGYDGVVIIEGPDNKSAAACLMALGAAGITGLSTTVLLTSQEAQEAMQQAGSVRSDYAPPAA